MLAYFALSPLAGSPSETLVQRRFVPEATDAEPTWAPSSVHHSLVVQFHVEPAWGVLSALPQAPDRLGACLAQMGTATGQLALQPVLRLLCQAHDPVCLLDRVKLVVHRPRPEPLDSRKLPAADFCLRARQHGLAEERSWDSPS